MEYFLNQRDLKRFTNYQVARHGRRAVELVRVGRLLSTSDTSLTPGIRAWLGSPAGRTFEYAPADEPQTDRDNGRGVPREL